jgi:N-acetyl-anhydromuramoyl-L-alanine amidase
MLQQALQIGIDGWLPGLRRVDSPNADARPAQSPVTLVVIHNISLPPGRYGADQIEGLFCGRLDAGGNAFLERLAGVRVSSHFLIERDGRSTQFVSCLDRAWHAGVSVFRGRANCNDYSIGIELEGTDFEPYTAAQYARLNALLAALRAAFPIEAVVGHSRIAPGRKTDPGPFFDWDRLEVPAALLQP